MRSDEEMGSVENLFAIDPMITPFWLTILARDWLNTTAITSEFREARQESGGFIGLASWFRTMVIQRLINFLVGIADGVDTTAAVSRSLRVNLSTTLYIYIACL